MSGQKRFDEIDIAKGIGIFLILLGHLEPGILLMRFVYSFHLFLFFACSGFLGQRYETRHVSSVIINNVKRLIVPYLIWSIITQAVALFLHEIDLMQAARNLLFLDANVGWNAALWFLVALFGSDTLCCFFVKCQRWVQFLFIVLLILLWYLLALYEITLPFGLYTVPIASFFWMLGYYMSKTDLIIRIRQFSRMAISIWVVVLLLVNITFGTVLNTVISIYHINYENFLFTIIAGVTGVLAIIILCGSLFNCRTVNSVFIVYGKNTLTILCTHYFILRMVGGISLRIIGINLWRAQSTSKSLLFALVLSLFYYPMIKALSKLKEKRSWIKYIV